MRFLYTLTAYPPFIGGAQLHHHLLGQQMLRKHSVQVVCHWNQNRTDWLLGTTLNAPIVSKDYYIDNIPVHRLGLTIAEKISMAPMLPLYYPLMDLALPVITEVIAKHLEPFGNQSDLVHNVRIGREGLSYASLEIARKYDIPFILTPVHHPRWTGWRYRAYNRLYNQADAIIALTLSEKQSLIALGVQDDKVSVTGIGPFLSDVAYPAQFLEAHQIFKPFVLFLGQHYLYKGYKQLLRATSLVWQNFPDIHFVFIGPSVNQSERDFLGCDARIHRLGAVDLQTKTNAIAACELLCVPSTQESFGGVYTEAWFFGKPVIGCNIPAVAEVIDNGIDGYLVDQVPSQIGEAICQLLNNPLLSKQMGKIGQTKVQNRYTWEQLAWKTEQVYQKVLNGSKIG